MKVYKMARKSLVNCPENQSVSLSVKPVGRSIGRTIDMSVSRFVGRSVGSYSKLCRIMFCFALLSFLELRIVPADASATEKAAPASRKGSAAESVVTDGPE